VTDSKTRVLVVEDGRVDFEMVRAVLSSTMNVAHAETLADGIALAKCEPPTCVLLDLGLPDSEGVKTLERFVLEVPELPVVVLTGFNDDNLGARLVQSGAQDYLAKGDVRPSILLRTLRHAIERANIQRALQDARAQLVRAQRLDAFGQLASGMAHDFNNLLAVISTTAGLAFQRVGRNSELSEDLSDILEATDRGRQLVSQLLTFARRRPGKPKHVAVGAQVHALRRILDRTLGSDVQLVVDTADPGPNVRIDPGMLDQVLLNLVVNARDAMPHGGNIRVTSGWNEAGQASIQVVDTGVGMTAEQSRRAIEPFFTTKAQGNGLGLSMCYGIIEQAGGRLSLDSEPGRGTTVSIVLPAVEELDRVARPMSPKEVARPAKLQVLLVEDMPALRRVLRRVLQREGATVFEVADGKSALDTVRSEPHLDVVVSDVSLPLLSGPEVARILNDIQPELPVVLMSGGGIPPAEELAPNVLEVLEKPFKPAVLLDTVSRAMASSKARAGAR
jgi:two-component system cell cycle sensor histidine kinase/response regulator CckA